jgi:hypothetical protein
MLVDRLSCTISSLALLAATSCTSIPADDDLAEQGAPKTDAPATRAALYARVASARAEHAQEVAGPTVPAEPLALAEPLGPGLRGRAPGRSARKVVHEDVNEAENLFFTEDGRLFVSATEDIYEIKRAEDGTFTKTDHFDGDCVVEGIVRRENYLYGVCWVMDPDLSIHSWLIAGELTEDPSFEIIGVLDDAVVPNGMTVDPEGRVYITYSAIEGQIVRLTFDEPLKVAKKEIWAEGLPNVNGIKYLNGSMYVTQLDLSLTASFLQVPIRPDGSAGKPQKLFSRWFTVLDDVLPFDDGFIVTDFLAGTLVFWNPSRGVYAETPSKTFFSPSSVLRGQPPMFNDTQLLITEKGNFGTRDEKDGDLLSVYQLP